MATHPLLRMQLKAQEIQNDYPSRKFKKREAEREAIF